MNLCALTFALANKLIPHYGVSQPEQRCRTKKSSISLGLIVLLSNVIKIELVQANGIKMKD